MSALITALTTILWKPIESLGSLIADRLFAGGWLRLSKRIREESRSRAESSARNERLRSALGVLAEGLALNLATDESRLKISQAINALQLEGPTSIDPDLDRVVATVASTITRTYTMPEQTIHSLMKPIREKVGPLITKRG